MSAGKSPRSWWQAIADFVRALDDMDSRSQYDALWARVTRLEALVAELASSSRSEWPDIVRHSPVSAAKADGPAKAATDDL
jgi:hypothetical protein